MFLKLGFTNSIAKIAAGVMILALFYSACDNSPTGPGIPPRDRIIVQDFIRDFQYIRSMKFDLGLPEHFENAADVVESVKLFSQARADMQNNIYARMYLDPRPTPGDSSSVLDSSESLGSDRVLSVMEIDPIDYSLDSVFRIVTLNRPAPRSTFIGSWIKMRRLDGSTYDIGKINTDSFSTSDTLTLKLLKPDRYQDFPVTASYEWKSVYRLPRRAGIDQFNSDSFNVNIIKGPVGAEKDTTNPNSEAGNSYTSLLGLDQYGTSGLTSDGIIDSITVKLIDNSLVFEFPHKQPFDTDTSYNPGVSIQERVPEIYDPDLTRDDISFASKYYFSITSYITPVIGDIDLNGTTFDSGDAGLFLRYFVFGRSVFRDALDEQIANTDMNRDRKPLTLSDFILLIRFSNDDLTSIPPRVSLPETVTITNQHGFLSIDKPLGGLFLFCESGGEKPELSYDQEGMKLDFTWSTSDFGEGVIIYPGFFFENKSNFSTLQPGLFLVTGASVDSAIAVDSLGNAMRTIIKQQL